MKDFQAFKQGQFSKKPALKKAYDDLAPQYELATRVIEARINKGLSQAEVAQKAGTRQSSIARLESGEYNPSLRFLEKVAKATGTKLAVKFE